MRISLNNSYYFNFKTLHFYCRGNIMIKFGSMFFRDLFEWIDLILSLQLYSLNECLWNIISNRCSESRLFELFFIPNYLLLVHWMILESFQLIPNWIYFFTIWYCYLILCRYQVHYLNCFGHFGILVCSRSFSHYISRNKSFQSYILLHALLQYLWTSYYHNHCMNGIIDINAYMENDIMSYYWKCANRFAILYDNQYLDVVISSPFYV